jgi:hypothetical protein
VKGSATAKSTARFDARSLTRGTRHPKLLSQVPGQGIALQPDPVMTLRPHVGDEVVAGPTAGPRSVTRMVLVEGMARRAHADVRALPSRIHMR